MSFTKLVFIFLNRWESATRQLIIGTYLYETGDKWNILQYSSMDNEKLPCFYEELFYNSLETVNQISGILFV